MPLKLVDIDDRLIHGQVATTWIPDFGIESVIIVNDACANDPVQRSVAGLNVSGMRFNDERQRIHKNMSITADEKRAFEELESLGVECWMQTTTRDTKERVPDLLKNFKG